MKKICLGFATLLLGSSLTFGNEADGNYNPFKNSEKPTATAQSAGLTPKRAKSFTPISKGAIKQASLTSQLDSIANDSPFEGAPPMQPPPGIADDFPVAPPVAQPQPLVLEEQTVEQTPVIAVPVQPEPVVIEPVDQPPVGDTVAGSRDAEPVVQEPVVQEPAPQVPTPQVPVVQEQPAVKVPVIQVPETVPAVEPAPANDTYSFVYAELEQFRNELAQIKKDNAKPDTKKAWSAPKVMGLISLDSINFMDQDNTANNMQNAAGFRELRLGATGTGYDSFDYKIEFGFNNNTGRVALIDNWVGVKNLPLLGYVRAGHFKPETGLYLPMGPTTMSLMECVTPATVFGLGRRIGVSSEHLFANDRVRLFFGVFQSGATDMNRYLQEDNQGEVVNLRLTTAPVFAQEGKKLLHLGGHWEFVSTDNKTASHSATPGGFGGFGFGTAQTLTTTAFDNDYSHRGGLEVAYQNGRFSARSEILAGSFAAYGNAPKRNMNGAYVELGYFLTDGFRIYDLKKGSFGAVKMNKNFHPFASGDWNLIDSFGAWQAVFQWGYTDMSDWSDILPSLAGEQTDLIFGLNWFWNPQMRMIFEYVHSEQCIDNHTHPSQDIFGMSLRVNW